MEDTLMAADLFLVDVEPVKREEWKKIDFLTKIGPVVANIVIHKLHPAYYENRIVLNNLLCENIVNCGV